MSAEEVGRRLSYGRTEFNPLEFGLCWPLLPLLKEVLDDIIRGAISSIISVSLGQFVGFICWLNDIIAYRYQTCSRTRVVAWSFPLQNS